MSCDQSWVALLHEKNAEIERLKKDVEWWKGAHAVAVVDRDIERERRAAFQQVLGGAFRMGYVDEAKASPSWLAEAKRLLGI